MENWVFESGKPDAELKLIDFGLSTYFGKVRCGALRFRVSLMRLTMRHLWSECIYALNHA